MILWRGLPIASKKTAPLVSISRLFSSRWTTILFILAQHGKRRNKKKSRRKVHAPYEISGDLHSQASLNYKLITRRVMVRFSAPFCLVITSGTPNPVHLPFSSLFFLRFRFFLSRPRSTSASPAHLRLFFVTSPFFFFFCKKPVRAAAVPTLLFSLKISRQTDARLPGESITFSPRGKKSLPPPLATFARINCFAEICIRPGSSKFHPGKNRGKINGGCVVQLRVSRIDEPSRINATTRCSFISGIPESCRFSSKTFKSSECWSPRLFLVLAQWVNYVNFSAVYWFIVCVLNKKSVKYFVHPRWKI